MITCNVKQSAWEQMAAHVAVRLQRESTKCKWERGNSLRIQWRNLKLNVPLRANMRM